MHKGKFIVLEGLEGAGKTTLAKFIVAELSRHGVPEVLLTRQPGGTPLAEQLRDLLKRLNSNEPLYPETGLLLLYAARIQLIKQIIEPALAMGKWVVCDRHELSTQAYQGGGYGLSMELITQLRKAFLKNLQPDLTFYLDISPEQGLQRVKQRGSQDRIEQHSLEFFQRVRQRYLSLAAIDKNIIIIDGSKPVQQVTEQLLQALITWVIQQE